MARPVLTPADRARGAFLGLAAAAGFGPRSLRGEVALARLLGEELLEAEPDLHRLVGRWIGWWRQDGDGITLTTADALDHLARYDAPAPADGATAEGAPLMVTVPVALVNAGQPRNLVSGTYHIIMLTHPDPHVAWSAVAVNIAVSCFLQGRRDFIHDVIEALAANDAPAELLLVVRRIPLLARKELMPGRPAAGAAIATAEAALWMAYHEPLMERGVRWLAGAAGDASVNAAVAGALFGARDGEQEIPLEWLAGVEEVARLRDLAKRLVRVES